VPGIEAYIAEFTSERAAGEDGYLARKGLSPLPEAERQQVRSRVEQLEPLSL